MVILHLLRKVNVTVIVLSQIKYLYASLFLRFSQDKEAKYTIILERLEQSDDEKSSNISDLDI